MQVAQTIMGHAVWPVNCQSGFGPCMGGVSGGSKMEATCDEQACPLAVGVGVGWPPSLQSHLLSIPSPTGLILCMNE